MSCLMSTSPYEVGLLSLIGCGFQFGVNRFEKEYLRKCAFWQRLQAGMYVAHVSLEIDVESLGSPLECTPLIRPPPHPHNTGRPHHPDAKENIHATLTHARSWTETLALSLIHMHRNNKNKKGGLVNGWNKWKNQQIQSFSHQNLLYQSDFWNILHHVK